MEAAPAAKRARAGSPSAAERAQPAAAKRAESPEAGQYDSWAEGFVARRAAALQAHSREEMLAAIFEAWDRDGNGSLSFEEVLPHYMKCARHHNLLEPQVRTSFEHLMASQGKTIDDGITLELFRLWLRKLTVEQVAAHYVRHVQGWTRHPYKMNISQAVVKGFKPKTLRQLLDCPVHALSGLSHLADGALAPLGLHTVRDLGGWKCFLIARAICVLATKEIPDKDWHPLKGQEYMNIRNALKEEHATATLRHVMHLPVSALSIFPEQGQDALQAINIRTIQHLGKRRYFIWANAMLELERFETEVLEPVQGTSALGVADAGRGHAAV